MAAKDEDYEHWPDDDKLAAVSAAPAPRYDSHNGLYEHIYRPAGEVKDAAPAPDKPKQDAPPLPKQYMPFPQMAYGGQMPYMAYPAPAYYGYGGGKAHSSRSLPRIRDEHPVLTTQVPYGAPPAYANYTTAPADDKPTKDSKEKTKPKTKAKAPSPRKWQGRTKAEVEEDDMKIAASQGAYAERKVQPLGLADDQVVWVVEMDGGNVLR